MPVSQAYKLCPDAAFVPVNIRLYVQVSANVMEIMKGFAEKFRQYSIDEAYLVLGPEIRRNGSGKWGSGKSRRRMVWIKDSYAATFRVY